MDYKGDVSKNDETTCHYQSRRGGKSTGTRVKSLIDMQFNSATS